MNAWISGAARRIRAFVEHSITKISTGLILFLTALYEIEEGILIEISQQGPQSHHGIAAFGILTMIAAIPDLLEGVAATAEHIEKLKDSD